MTVHAILTKLLGSMNRRLMIICFLSKTTCTWLLWKFWKVCAECNFYGQRKIQIKLLLQKIAILKLSPYCMQYNCRRNIIKYGIYLSPWKYDILVMQQGKSQIQIWFMFLSFQIKQEPTQRKAKVDLLELTTPANLF